MAQHLPQTLPCPVCGSRPSIDVCAPWPRDCGPPAWYAICYQPGEDEHCVGVNGDNQRNVMEVWNEEVARMVQQTPIGAGETK